MKKIITIMLIAMVAIVSLYAKGKKDAAKAEVAPMVMVQTTCPVMNNPIDSTIYTDYKGTRVYFCCGGCPSMFAKNPDHYMEILKNQEMEAMHSDESEEVKTTIGKHHEAIVQ